MRRFDGKVALVTGAANGIGKATALQLASEGASVALADIDTAGAEQVAREIEEKHGGSTTVLYFDALDTASCRKIVNQTVDRFGQLDVLCNIAGIATGGWNSHEMPEEDWHRMVAINLTSVFMTSQAAIPHLLKTRGNIVNMSSASGKMGQSYVTCYCATKAGVIMMTKALAMEYGKKGLRANAICPGGVKTRIQNQWQAPEDADMSLLDRLMPQVDMATPEEIALAVAYIASDDARFVTGADFSIDGAQTAG